MSSRAYHYAAAEKLLLAGASTVDKIREIAHLRSEVAAQAYNPGVDQQQADKTDAHLTERMDEYGKKAMGIWAQAHVHATLALATEATELGSGDFDPTVLNR